MKLITNLRKGLSSIPTLRLVYWKILGKYYDLKKLLRYGTIDTFNDLNIETITTCNRRCSYCPNSIFERSLPKNEKLMDEDIFKKVIDELSEMRYNGRISPHFYGEPLLDKRMIYLIRYIRDKLPESKIRLITNGDFLTIELFKELSKSGVNEFYITQHGKTISQNMSLLFTYLKDNHSDKAKVEYKKLERLSNRGGIIKTKNKQLPYCLCPINPLVIDYEGNVILCCNDYRSSIKFGNVRQESLKDIWKKENYQKIRKQLKKRIFKLPICKKCAGIL